jgi:hypothetical protein
MLNTKYFRVAVLTGAMAGLAFSNVGLISQPGIVKASTSIIVDAPDAGERNATSPESVRASDEFAAAVAPDPLDSTSTFYTVRADPRRCISPMCGGFFVKRVNLPLTRCADGRSKPECYLAEIEWNGQPEVEAGMSILRGRIVPKQFARFGNLGALRVTESWKAITDHRPEGTFYLVRDRGVRCIAAPCPSHHEARINSTLSRNIAGIDEMQDGSGISLADPGGVIIAGEHVPVTGPAGKSVQLKASQIFQRQNDVAMKPCIKTGCSSQICADHNVITTCEWRPEYACYQKATCERQRDGNCGFTPSAELTACLAK